MDFSSLLNTQIPFDQNKLNLLDAVTNTLYTTSNAQDRETANKILNQFQEQVESFHACDFILTHSNSLYTKVFALGIIENVVKTKWNLLEAKNRIGIRNFLVDILIKNVTNNDLYTRNSFFVNKLNIVIVSIAKNEWTTSWPNFISELCNSSKSDQNLCENNMKLLQLLSEEINERWRVTSKRERELKTKMSNEFSQVFYLCQFIFDNATSVNQSVHVESVKLFSEYITWFPVELSFNERVIQQFLSNLKDMGYIRVEIIKCIGKLFEVNFDRIKQENQQQYFQIKEYTMKIYKTFITQMVTLTNNTDFSEKHKTISASKIGGFERLTLQFEIALISFFKNNFNFIEQFDFPIGTQKSNDFINAYFEQIMQGLQYMTQFLLIQNEEIFKAAADFWYWFLFKISFIKSPDIDPDKNDDQFAEDSIQKYIMYAIDMYNYRSFYLPLIDKVRNIIIVKMNKPLEVKIDIDENGDLTTDPTTNTIYQEIHETLKKALVLLTLLDKDKTQDFLEKSLDDLLAQAGKELNGTLLNSLSWSVGCIAGTMEESVEKKFVVNIIKALLTLCEQTKGKDNKAVCASDIMYVVGQYPRFLNKYWKFLKTVVKKLFEFMHELHPGVQDFACETFLKISMKCGAEFIKLQEISEGEQEPYINVLVRTVSQSTSDLQPHQQLMFYEALGNMINEEKNDKKKAYLIEQLMQSTFANWSQFFQEAAMNADVIRNRVVVKSLELIVRINERVAFSTKNMYWIFGEKLFDNMLKTYEFYCNIINDSFNKNQLVDINIKALQSFNKTLLKYFCTVISYCLNEDIMSLMLPQLGKIIEVYISSHVNNRDPNVLLVFNSVLKKLGKRDYNCIEKIWQYLCIFTLQMIKDDYQSFPEHRMNFFTLLKTLISCAFDAFFKVQESNFNKDVIDSLTWAIRHHQTELYVTGLETLYLLISYVASYRMINNINIADDFCRVYYFPILNDVFYVLTDSFHKAGFKIQSEIIRYLINIVESGLISEGIFNQGQQNKIFVLQQLSSMLISPFPQLNKNQIETFCLELFNKCNSPDLFKICVRDFLISLKSFSERNEELYEEEKKKQLEEAKRNEEKRRAFIPGMAPVYDQEMQNRVSSVNYLDKEMN